MILCGIEQKKKSDSKNLRNDISDQINHQKEQTAK